MKRSTADPSPAEAGHRPNPPEPDSGTDAAGRWQIPSGSDLLRFAIGGGFLAKRFLTPRAHPRRTRWTGDF